MDTCNVGSDNARAACFGRRIVLITCLVLPVATWGSDPSTTFTKHVIDDSYHHDPFDVQPIDMDNDGDMDFVSGATYFGRGALSWWENDGSQSFTEHLISGAGNFWVVWPVDMNGDGSVDILTERDWERSDYRLTLWINDGSERFTSHDLLTYPDRTVCSRNVSIADVDGDEDVDILCAWARDLKWYENQGTLDFVEHVIVSQPLPVPSPYRDMWAADLDGDQDNDLITALQGTSTEPPEITWWENDGRQNFTAHTAATLVYPQAPLDVDSADVDGDDDIDILVASKVHGNVTGQVLWLENEGTGDFTQHVVDDHYVEANLVTSADFDLDGDTDIIAAAYFEDSIRWYENDGSAAFTQHTLASNVRGVNAVRPTDLDGDRDPDILAQAFFQRDILWWENDLEPPFISPGVGGSVTGIIPDTVGCLNLATGQNVDIALEGGVSTWNCEDEGLQVAPGDRVIMTVDGTVPRDGDLNGDGCIDRNDGNILLEYVRGSGPYNAEYDLNDDGLVNIADVRTIVLLFDNPGGEPCD